MRKILGAIAIASTVLALPACEAGHPSKHRTDVSQVYTSGGGYFTPAYDPALDQIVWYQLLFTPQQSPTFNPAGRSSLDGGSWARTTAAPSGLSGTGVVVRTDAGRPGTDTEDMEPLTEATEDGDAIVDEDTDAAEAAEAESAVDAANDAADSAGDSAGDSGGSSDSGGADAGGGDAGGSGGE